MSEQNATEKIKRAAQEHARIHDDPNSSAAWKRRADDALLAAVMNEDNEGE